MSQAAPRYPFDGEQRTATEVAALLPCYTVRWIRERLREGVATTAAMHQAWSKRAARVGFGGRTSRRRAAKSLGW